MASGFSTGIVYFIGNHEIQAILQSYLDFLSIPVIPLIWMFFGIIMVTYLYLTTIRKFTIFPISLWITRFLIAVMMLGISFTVLFHDMISFFQLQVANALISSLAGIVATLYLTPMMRRVLGEEHKSVHRAQFRWFLIMISALFLASVVLAIDSTYKLVFSINIIYTPTYTAMTLLYTIAIVALHIVNEGNLTHLVDYPAKMRDYISLTRLYNTIQDEIQFPDAYDIPLPKRPAPDQIDILNYHLVIQISDRYSWLEDPQFKQSIAKIIQSDASGNQIISELAAIKI
jgi:hypothetical protein